MAYFSNGTEGEVFAEQCGRCVYGMSYCPIHFVQTEYNYQAVNNEVAIKILEALVKQDGTCNVFVEFGLSCVSKTESLFPEYVPEIANKEK